MSCGFWDSYMKVYRNLTIVLIEYAHHATLNRK
jgi:hypothetical protein